MADWATVGHPKCVEVAQSILELKPDEIIGQAVKAARSAMYTIYFKTVSPLTGQELIAALDE